jgi:hypothetical protein
VRDCPTHFVFGCSSTNNVRLPFWQVLEEVIGSAYASSFRGFSPRKQWMELMSWLDGDGPFEDDEFDVIFGAFVDLVAELLRVHPTWG